MIQDIIDMIEEENTEAALLFLDFKKAFDTVNHDFLFKTLERYKFGNSFTNWVKIMYNKAESCVTNNGWVSKPLKIKCGIRQGCPLSALLFLLVVEILALKIKEEKGDGLEFINSDGSKEYLHITQLADDATLILRNENAVINTLQKVKYFGKISGLEINMDKTEGMWLGHGKNRNDNFAGINWQKDMVKALGVWFGYNKTETETRNWQSKLESIKNTLNTWSCRDLTFQGRVLIIKTLALSKIVYLMASINTPTWVINEVNKIFFAFIWKGKRDKICRKVMINEIENGGMNMIDVKLFNTALKANWVSRIWTRETESWTIIPRKYMKGYNINMLMCMNFDQKKTITNKITNILSRCNTSLAPMWWRS